MKQELCPLPKGKMWARALVKARLCKIWFASYGHDETSDGAIYSVHHNKSLIRISEWAFKFHSIYLNYPETDFLSSGSKREWLICMKSLWCRCRLCWRISNRTTFHICEVVGLIIQPYWQQDYLWRDRDVGGQLIRLLIKTLQAYISNTCCTIRRKLVIIQ